MPPLEYTDLRQLMVLWQCARQDRQGLPVLHPPTQVNCRWVEQETQQQDAYGNTVSYDGTVILASLIPNKSIAMLATLGSPITNLFQLVQAKNTPDIKGRIHRYEYRLMRFGNTLPTVLGT